MSKTRTFVKTRCNMKNNFSRILCTALCCAPLFAAAQTSERITSHQRLYQEGQSLFQQKAYAAAIPPLTSFIRQTDAEGNPVPDAGERMEAEYMLACAAYELKDGKSLDILQAYLDRYPDNPYANRIYALMGLRLLLRRIMTPPWHCSTPPASTC